MRLLWLAFALALFIAPARAQDISTSGVSSINGCQGVCTVQPGNFIGSFTVATLPTCNGTSIPYGNIAYVTDLGGGGNNVKCLNALGVNAWTHFNYGIPGAISAASGTVPVTPLISPPIMQLTGTIALATTLTLQLQTANLYPGYDFYVVAPATVLGSIVATVQGVSGLSLNILGGSTHHYSWNGTTLITLQ